MKNASLLAYLLVFITASGFSQEAVRHQFHAGRGGDVPSIQIPIQNTATSLLIDTGCTLNVLDKEFLPLFEEGVGTMSAETPFGKRESKIWLLKEANSKMLPSWIQTKCGVLVEDFTGYRRSLGRRVKGIVGLETLKNFSIVMNFDEARFELRSPLKPPLDGIALEIFYFDTMPSVAGTLQNQSVTFGIDTGSNNAVILPTQLVDKLMAAGKFQVLGQSTTVGLNNERRQIRTGELSEFLLGSVVLTNVPAMETAGSARIGMGFLSRFNTEIDLVNNKLKLAQRSQSPVERPNLGKLLGVKLMDFTERGARFSGVDPDGILGRAGMPDTATIATVDNVAVGFDGMDLFDFWDYCISSEGKAITLQGTDAHSSVSWVATLPKQQ